MGDKINPLYGKNKGCISPVFMYCLGGVPARKKGTDFLFFHFLKKHNFRKKIPGFYSIPNKKGCLLPLSPAVFLSTFRYWRRRDHIAFCFRPFLLTSSVLRQLLYCFQILGLIFSASAFVLSGGSKK